MRGTLAAKGAADLTIFDAMAATAEQAADLKKLWDAEIAHRENMRKIGVRL